MPRPRELELEAIRRALVEAVEDGARTVFLTGPRGAGKTHLCDQIAAEAGARGLLVLSGAASPADPPGSLGAVAELLVGASRNADVLATRPTPPPPVSPIVVFENLVRVLGGLARGRGLVCLLDDMQWADGTTVAAVEHAARSLSDLPILWVVTITSGVESDAMTLARRWAAAPSALHVALGPLSREALVEVVRTTVGSLVPVEVMQEIAALADGLPGSAVRLARERATQGKAAWPALVQREIRERIDSLPPSSAAVVRTAAVVGPLPDLEPLWPAADVTPAAGRAAVTDLIDRELFATDSRTGTVWFRHDEVRLAVLAGLLPRERDAVARRARAVLTAAVERGAGDATAVLLDRLGDLHRILGDHAGAREAYGSAARVHGDAGRFAAAESVLSRAADLITGEANLDIDLLEARLLHGAAVGDAASALSAGLPLPALLTEQAAPAARRARMHLALATATLAGLAPEQADPHLEAARDLAAAAGDDALAAAVTTATARVRLLARNPDRTTAMRMLVELLQGLDRARQPVARTACLLVLAPASERDDIATTSRLLREAQSIGERSRRPDLRARAQLALAAAHARATLDLDPLLRAGEAVVAERLVDLTAGADLLIGEMSLRLGDDDGALVHLDRSAAAGRAHGLGSLPETLAWLAAAHAAAGRDDEASSCAREAEELAPGRPDVDVVLALGVHARSHFMLEERDRAAASIERAAAVASGLPRVVAPVAGLRALMGSLAGALSSVPQDEAWTRIDRGYAAAAAAVVHGRHGRADEAVAAFEDAVAYLDPAPWDRHLATRLVAEAALAGGWGDPVAWLRTALAFFDERGNRPIARACRRLLAQCGVPVPRRRGAVERVSPELRALGVTAREMEVLELVRAGASNAQIAGRLYLSRHTVKTHVARLMQKTGAQSRIDLADLIDLTDAADAGGTTARTGTGQRR